jgi:TetR/AcrR family transcriptional regulator
MKGGRDAIVKAATEVFGQKGFAGASTREICAAAGITKPVLYYYFRSKEHLFQELMTDCYSRQRKMMLRASQIRGSLRERLIRVLYSDFQEVKKNRASTEMLVRMIFAPAEGHPPVDHIKEMDDQRAIIAAIFQEGVATGEVFGEPHLLATAFMGISTIAILENFFTGRKTLTRRSAEKFIDVLLHGCSGADPVYRMV